MLVTQLVCGAGDALGTSWGRFCASFAHDILRGRVPGCSRRPLGLGPYPLSANDGARVDSLVCRPWELGGLGEPHVGGVNKTVNRCE